ncbi:hypothetical protein BCN_3484 [Bacillus cereus NC7401]|nr:hypothetical protein BCN_3484 [Bacillus cereus NC7401]
MVSFKIPPAFAIHSDQILLNHRLSLMKLQSQTLFRLSVRSSHQI